jgi:S1-C subfamily serine protease
VSRPGALVLVIAATTLATLLPAATAGAPQQQLPAEDRIDLGVVAVEARVGGELVHGSGTVIDADRGLIVTSARTIWGATSLKVDTGLGVLHGRIVARAPCDELALLETQPRVPGLVSLADGAGPAPSRGALVTAYGRRLTRVGPGLLTVPARVVGSPLRLDGAQLPESAGGPVLDVEGRLVGIVDGTGGTLAWSEVKERVDELQPGPRRVFAGWRGQYNCVKRMHRITRAAHPGFRIEDARLTAPVPATRIPGVEVHG